MYIVFLYYKISLYHPLMQRLSHSCFTTTSATKSLSTHSRVCVCWNRFFTRNKKRNKYKRFTLINNNGKRECCDVVKSNFAGEKKHREHYWYYILQRQSNWKKSKGRMDAQKRKGKKERKEVKIEALAMFVVLPFLSFYRIHATQSTTSTTLVCHEMT